MDSHLLKILSDEIMKTRNLVVETRKMTEETKRSADAAWEETKQTKRIADAAQKKADAAWELVVMTRNQIQEELQYMRLPGGKEFSKFKL